MIRFTGIHTNELHIAKWAIISIYSYENITYIDLGFEKNAFQVKETVEEALRLWESTE